MWVGGAKHGRDPQRGLQGAAPRGMLGRNGSDGLAHGPLAALRWRNLPPADSLAFTRFPHAVQERCSLPDIFG